MTAFEKLRLVKNIIFTTSCLLDYNYIIATDLSKQQALDADPNVIQQINFTGNLAWLGNTILDFWQGTVKVLWIYFTLM